MKKLSARLQRIYEWGSSSHYQNIYDICCDHGYLAYEFWQKKSADVYAIDIATPVINELNKKYLTKTDNRFKVICAGGEDIDYIDNSLIIIAGVGAYTTKKILNKILSDSLVNTEIILCCHQNTDILRHYLQSTDLGLVNEALVTDKGKFYELIHLSTSKTSPKVEEVGSLMWNGDNRSELSAYLDRQLKHWGIRRDREAYAILEAYKELNQQWES